ncbi:MAG: hypothetical protein ABIG61_06105 [Planctomycetota bacterium]
MLTRQQSGQGTKRLNIWRIIMKSRITKFAAAAVIIIAILVAINQFGGSIDGASVAWASLAERVGRIQTCFFKGHSKITGGPLGEKAKEQELEIYLSSEYGFRAGTYMDGNVRMIQYVIPSEKVIISLMPTQKQYMRMLLTDEMLKKMRLQGNDPREMIRQIMLGEYTHLGESIIDGVKVEGIETNDPRAGGGQFEKYLARCWVDVETQLPVLLEMEMEMSAGPDTSPMKMSMILDNFEWDINLGPEIFEPNIPSDYKLMAEMQMPGQDEGSAVKGLRIFAEITGGKYPQKLAVMDVMREITEVIKTNSEKEWQSKRISDPNFKPTQEEKEGIRNKAMPKMMAVQGACMFYAELVKADKDAAYYGDQVTSDDVDAVLMRWKISDDEYRVIYGDLAAENISTEQLAELEATISK